MRHAAGRRIAAATFAAASLVALRPAAADEILVFAAASLAGALDDVADAFADGGAPVTVSYAGTAALARQIEAGAAADIFISADDAWMDYVEERGLIDPASRTDLLGNRLVLVAPDGATTGGAEGPTELIAGTVGVDARLAMADVDAVPAGRYGRAALESLGIWNAVAPYIVESENVRAALAFVARGEARLGIVYATDAAAEPDVEVVATFADELHPPIVYPAAATTTADADSRAFLAFLGGPEAAAIFAGYGFTILPQN